MSDASCYSCGHPVDPQGDAWWGYQWKEHPPPEAVEEAIEQGDEFGHWFVENHVLCPTCHERVQRAIGSPGVHPESETVLASVDPEHAAAILGTRPADAPGRDAHPKLGSGSGSGSAPGGDTGASAGGRTADRLASTRHPGAGVHRPRKRWEFRRQPPAQPTPYRLVLYATAGEKAIVGEAVVTEHVTGPVGHVAVRTVAETPQDATDVWEYFDGCEEATALRLARPRAYGRSRLTLERCRQLVEDFHPPQNFQYLRRDEHAPLLDRLPPREACPACRSYAWMPGLCGADEVPGAGAGAGGYRAVHHCGVCERAVVRHAAQPTGTLAEGEEVVP